MNSPWQHPNRRARLIGELAALAALAVMAGLVSPAPITNSPPRTNATVPPAALRAPAGQSAPIVPVMPRSDPIRVSIPAIDAVSSLIPLGLNPDQTVQVPPLSDPMQAGWYALGSTPGERGTSVILGHVDGYNRPGIFFRLHELRPGDQILVAREDGTTVRFDIYRTEQVPKTRFPTDKVYGTAGRPELRLVTCGGEFDWESGNYLDNIIVYATLAALN